MNDEQNKERKGQLEGWFILELFGHNKIAGKVSEVTLGTNVMLRVDVPEIKYREQDYNTDKIAEKCIPAFTKFYNPSAVYAATPVTEETAKAVMQNFQVGPFRSSTSDQRCRLRLRNDLTTMKIETKSLILIAVQTGTNYDSKPLSNRHRQVGDHQPMWQIPLPP